MTWVKIDDNFAEHPKIAELPSDAIRWFHVRAMCYAARYKTKGEITPAMLKALGGKPAYVAALVAVALWDTTSRGGWAIHDFEEYNPSRSVDPGLSQKRADAGRAGGKQTAKQNGSKTEANLLEDSSKTEATPRACAAARAFPSPTPSTSKEVQARSKGITLDFIQEEQRKHPRVNVREVYEDAKNRKVWDGYKDKRRALVKYIGWAEEKLGTAAAPIREEGIFS